VGRHGSPPVVRAAPDIDALTALAAREVESNREKGCQTIALLCKTGGEAARWQRRLQAAAPAVRLIAGGESAAAERSLEGTTVMPIYLAKGLEFDAVVVLSADRRTFHTPDDKRLLYIACTRALHHLTLLYTGEKAEWI
jgi:DNA helicase-2/ATP-dependent DNA helicase PcrA